MEIKVIPTFYGNMNIFGYNFNDEQISESKIFIDNNTQEMNYTKQISLSYNQEHTIKILLEGNLEDASYMFYSRKYMKIKFYKNFNDTKRRLFDKSNIKNMNSMFYLANNIEIDVSFFNMANVIDMGSMFAYSSNANLYNLSSMKTNSVKNMSQMFRESDFILSDLSFLNTSSVIDMSYMFYGIKDKNLDLSNINTQSVRNMSYMFSQCSQITYLDLSKFNMENVLDISSIFEQSNNLRNITFWKLGINLITNMSNLFNNLIIEYLDLSTVNTTGVKDMTRMFYWNYNLKSINFGNFDTSKVV